MVRSALLLLVAFHGSALVAQTAPAKELFAQAESALKAREPRRALDLAIAARSLLGATNPRIEGLLAQAFMETGQPAEARIALSKLFRLVPESRRSDSFSSYRHLEERIDAALEEAQVQATTAEAELMREWADRDKEKRAHGPGRDAGFFFDRLGSTDDVRVLLAFHQAFPGTEPGRVAAEKARAIAERQQDALTKQFASTLDFADDALLDQGSEHNIFAVPYENGRRFVIFGRADGDIPFLYEDARQFSHGLAATRIDGKWGFIDRQGDVQVPHVYDAVIQSYNGEIAQVAVDDRRIFINAVGEELPELEPYAHVGKFLGDVAQAVTLDGKPLLIDRAGKPFLAAAGFHCGGFQYIESDEAWRYAVIDSQGRMGVISASGQTVISAIYDYVEVTDFNGSPGCVRARRNGKWGLLDAATGQPVTGFQYDAILPRQYGLTAFRANDKWGFLDAYGAVSAPAEYDSVPFGGLKLYGAGDQTFTDDGRLRITQGKAYAVVTKGDQRFLIDETGTATSEAFHREDSTGGDAAWAAYHAFQALEVYAAEADIPSRDGIIGSWDFMVDRQIEDAPSLRDFMFNEFGYLRDRIDSPVRVTQYARGSTTFRDNGDFESAQELTVRLRQFAADEPELRFTFYQSGVWSYVDGRIFPIITASRLEPANATAQVALRRTPEVRYKVSAPTPFDAVHLQYIADGESVVKLADPETDKSITLYRKPETLAPRFPPILAAP